MFLESRHFIHKIMLFYLRKSSILPNKRKERNKHVEGKTNKQTNGIEKYKFFDQLKRKAHST